MHGWQKAKASQAYEKSISRMLILYHRMGIHNVQPSIHTPHKFVNLYKT